MIIFVEMFVLEDGVNIIDILGIKILGFNFFEFVDVVYNFWEFFEVFENCCFGGNCLYCNEFGCVVKEGIEEGIISELRYINYFILLEEIEE